MHGRESGVGAVSPSEKPRIPERKEANRHEKGADFAEAAEAPATEQIVSPAELRARLLDKAFLQALSAETLPKDFTAIPEHSILSESLKSPDSIDDSDPTEEDFASYRGNQVLRKFAQSKVGKVLFGAAGLFGIGQSISTGKEAIETSFERGEAREAIHAEILDTTIERAARDHGLRFEHLTDMKETITFEGGEAATRAEMLSLLNDTWTDQLLNPDTSGLTKREADFNKTRAKALFSMIEANTGSYATDSGQKLDVRKVFDAYGDQLRMQHNQEFTGMLSALTDYSPANLRTHADVMRNSVLQAPDIRMGMYGMYEYDADNYSAHYADHRAKDKQERYDFADAFSMEVLEALDVDANPELRQDAANAAKESIRAIIHLDNEWTQVGTSLSGWNTHNIIRDGFMQDSTNYDGKPLQAGIEQFREAEQDAELALKKLAALEKNPNGSVHKMVDALLQAQEARAEKVFSEAKELGQGAEEFFANELIRYED